MADDFDRRYNSVIKSLLPVLSNPLPDEVVAGVTGNAPRAVKEAPIKAFQMFHRRMSFGGPVSARLRASEVSVSPNAEDPSKDECRVVSEMSVEEDMLGLDGFMTQGCIAFLIDESSAAATSAWLVLEGKASLNGVSQSFNIFFHTRATIGTKIKIIGRALGGNDYTVTCRAEIWDAEDHRMIAHGEQVMTSRTGKWRTLDELKNLVSIHAN